jgi:type II secretory pathway pseudopilin PulG
MKRRRTAGFTYLVALFVIAMIGVGLALLGELWQTAGQREKEAELLHVGNQYRRAIERYYLNGPRQYPRTLQDLLKDPRLPTTQRYIRQLYPDPITGTSEWVLVKGPDGGIMGVYSASEEPPLKRANFQVRDRDFEGAAKYSDWRFVYAPALQGKPKPTAAPAVPVGPSSGQR